mgnify:FL=1
MLSRYLQAKEKTGGQPRLVGSTVEIQASLPGLNGETRTGYFIGRRTIAEDGAIEFEMGAIEGDDTVKRYVIARYLNAEMEASKSEKVSLGITPENYKFEFRGLQTQFNRQYYVFGVQPRKKVAGLFEGELWLDPVTFLPRREYGRVAKTPSVFLSDVYFVRDYWLLDGKQVLRRMISDIDVRLYGTAHIEIWHSPHTFEGYPPPEVLTAKADSN